MFLDGADMEDVPVGTLPEPSDRSRSGCRRHGSDNSRHRESGAPGLFLPVRTDPAARRAGPSPSSNAQSTTRTGHSSAGLVRLSDLGHCQDGRSLRAPGVLSTVSDGDPRRAAVWATRPFTRSSHCPPIARPATAGKLPDFPPPTPPGPWRRGRSRTTGRNRFGSVPRAWA